ncbi:MAG: site-2 protease family protein [Anaerolineales bacterium]
MPPFDTPDEAGQTTDIQPILTQIVARVFEIEQITWATQKEKHLVRFVGHLRMDSQQAYDQLAAQLKPHRVVPLFREENGQQVIVLLNGTLETKPTNPWINLILFLITLASTVFVGYTYDGNWLNGVWYAMSILAILLAHEFGHYLAARYHGCHVTLPYFIPMPLPGSFGTMGAFIQLREPPKNRRVLHDIGVAGPLAGLVIAVPVLILGLSLSKLGHIPWRFESGEGIMLEGNSLLYLGLKYLVFGEVLPHPVSFWGGSPVLYWLRYFFTGQPAPLGALDVTLHPIAWAGWVGLLVTALNLIPAGQLDGGHTLFVLIGQRARAVLPIILVSLVLLGVFWNGWWLWAALIFFLGRTYAEPLDMITTLDARRKWIARFTLLMFVLVFIPVPLTVILG